MKLHALVVGLVCTLLFGAGCDRLMPGPDEDAAQPAASSADSDTGTDEAKGDSGSEKSAADSDENGAQTAAPRADSAAGKEEAKSDSGSKKDAADNE